MDTGHGWTLSWPDTKQQFCRSHIAPAIWCFPGLRNSEKTQTALEHGSTLIWQHKLGDGTDWQKCEQPWCPMPTTACTEQAGKYCYSRKCKYLQPFLNGTMGNSISFCTGLLDTLLQWGFSRHQYYWSGLFMPGLYLCLSLSITLTSWDAWKSFLSSVILDCCLHFYKTIEVWLWYLILPAFLWVVNSQGHNFGIDLVYLLIKLQSKTCWNFFAPTKLHKCYPRI